MDKLQIIDFDKAKLINSLPKEHADIYKKSFKTEDGISYDFFNFVSFCHAYADFLLNSGSFNTYELFTDSFNRLIEKDEVYRLIKNIFENEFTLCHNTLIGLELNKVLNGILISDKRIPVNNKDFKAESDLELLISSELKDFFGNEINIKRQQRIGYGITDILIDNSVAIELKKSKATRMNVYQTFEYSFDDRKPDLCLIASEFDDKTLKIATALGVSCYTYSFIYEENVNEYPVGIYLDKMNITNRSRFDDYMFEMNNSMFISYHNPIFNFNDIFNKKQKEVYQIWVRSKELSIKQEERLLKNIEQHGYDISKGLDGVIEQIENKEVAK